MHERRLASMFSVRDLYFTISWICCTSENKISYPREREIGMLCFFKEEGAWKGLLRGFYKSFGALAESTPESMNSWFKFRRASAVFPWRFQVKYARPTMEKGRLSPSPQGDRCTTICRRCCFDTSDTSDSPVFFYCCKSSCAGKWISKR